MCNWSPGRTKKCAIVLLTASHYESATLNLIQFSPVQSLGCVWLFVTAACQIPLSITNSQSLLKLMSIESVMPSNHLIFCHLLLLLPLIFPSIRVFSNESVCCIRWPKYWSFSFSISPSNVYSGLISFRMDWLDLLAVQGTLESLLQHHSLKASILLCIKCSLGISNFLEEISIIFSILSSSSVSLHWSLKKARSITNFLSL